MTRRDPHTDTCEVNFDGLVGPSHNYAGLSPGNLASERHARQVSRPRAAALQGLAKMRLVRSLGIAQAVIPPLRRPDLGVLRRLGFGGDRATALRRAAAEAPHLLAAVYSASPMWTANAATVCPSLDATDGRVHLTAANLVSKLHRSFEGSATATMLRHLFADPAHFAVHDPLPLHEQLGDEGAANHTRFAAHHGAPGVQLFVYGRSHEAGAPRPTRHAARQSLDASRAVARVNRVVPDRVVFAQQRPEAIDAGVFHNDVIAVGNENVLFYHEQALVDAPATISALRAALVGLLPSGADPREALVTYEVPEARVPLADAVSSYLFNAQLLTLPDGTMAIVAPEEARETPSVAALLDEVVGRGGPIRRVVFRDLRESMRNGGGPACLRLRVVLTARERAAVHPGVWLTDDLADRLEAWIVRHYRETLAPEDLADPALADEIDTALTGLAHLLGLGESAWG
jgi:succinylarginine dihydrolase